MKHFFTEKEVEKLINTFIKKWCGDNAPHLLDTDDNDGERLRQSIGYICQEAEMDIRKALWYFHGCPSHALYGDDGELQCSICIMDFKRMPIDDIVKKLARKAKEREQQTVENTISTIMKELRKLQPAQASEYAGCILIQEEQVKDILSDLKKSKGGE